MTTVFVDFTNPRRPFEVSRDARDPFDNQDAVEHVARALSQRERVIRIYAIGKYGKPWRKQRADYVLYEARDGVPINR